MTNYDDQLLFKNLANRQIVNINQFYLDDTGLFVYFPPSTIYDWQHSLKALVVKDSRMHGHMKNVWPPTAPVTADHHCQSVTFLLQCHSHIVCTGSFRANS